MLAKNWLLITLLLITISIVGCDGPAADDSTIRVEVVVDGTRTTYTYPRLTSVGQLLEEYEIEVSPLDDVNPRQFNQISDGMTITIVRVTEEIECSEYELNYEVQEINTTLLAPGEREIAQQGQNGREELCERIIRKDGEIDSRTPQRRTILVRPQDRIEYVGVEDRTEPVAIDGNLVYIASGQAFIIEENSSLRRPLTSEGGLDGRVFDLSEDGRYLLFTRQTSDETDAPFSNELWIVSTVGQPQPTPVHLEGSSLPLSDILAASWRPNTNNIFAYTTATASENFSGWSAYNDLHLAEVNPADGTLVGIDTIILNDASGAFAAWGTRHQWSHDGSLLAYAKADSIGLIDLEAGTYQPRFTFPYYGSSITSGWVWQPTLHWSYDNQWLVTTVHGAPYGGESEENSIIFDLGVININDNLIISELIRQIGIWGTPVYAPSRTNDIGIIEFSIAYLQARDPFNSVSTEYDLVIADRDGSNPRVLFPGNNQSGLRPFANQIETPFAWSPTGLQIIVVYQSDLWLIDVQSGVAQRITSEGPVSAIEWGA